MIKRAIDQPDDASEATLKEKAMAIAVDEGYQLTAAQIEVQARVSA